MKQEYVKYVVTGLLYQSTKRFVRTFTEPRWAFGINLWRGSVWGVTQDGKRKLLKRVTN